jgi:hypothetical protein
MSFGVLAVRNLLLAGGVRKRVGATSLPLPKSATSQLNAAQLVRVNSILSRTQLDSRKRLG